MNETMRIFRIIFFLVPTTISINKLVIFAMKFWTLLLFIAYFDINFSMVKSSYLLVELEGGFNATAGKSELKSHDAGKILFIRIPNTF